MNDETAFIQAILAAPDDATLRLVYADWLEKRGDVRAEFLRAEVELAAGPKFLPRSLALEARLKELRLDIDKDWLALLDRTQIEGCFRPEYSCPKRWEQLKPTEESHIRFCESCRKRVFYCASVEHAQRHANFGHCVAIDSRVTRRSSDLHTEMMRDPDMAGDPDMVYLGTGSPIRAAPRFHVGQRVRFRAGPHRGIEGTIRRLNLSDLRAAVSIDYSGRRTSLEIDFEDLEPQR